MVRFALGMCLLGAAVLATGCAILPVGGYDNEPAAAPKPNGDEPRKIGQYETHEVTSSAPLADLDVPWDLDPACRNGFYPTAATVQNGQLPKDVCPHLGDRERFLGMAISGGGSRSAVFSAGVLFELQKYGILQQVDVISSVSGGSYTAALYVLSCDADLVQREELPANKAAKRKFCPPTVEGPERTPWDPAVVNDLLERNFELRWFGNWFWPDNMLRYWLTDYSRSQIMAKTLDANLFDNSLVGGEPFRFQDLNPQRPNLIINATDNTNTIRYDDGLGKRVSPFLPGKPTDCRDAHYFAFTREHFAQMRSSLDEYPVSQAVVASSAFPGVFNYITLRDFGDPAKERYVHVLDAGPFDNLGLTSLSCVISLTRPTGKRAIVLVDAFVESPGKRSNEQATRSGFGYVVDLDALESTDVMLERLHEELKVKTDPGVDLVVIGFERVKHAQELSKSQRDRLYAVANSVGTRLSIDHCVAEWLRWAAAVSTHEGVKQIEAEAADKGAYGLVPAGNGYRPNIAAMEPTCQLPPDSQ